VGVSIEAACEKALAEALTVVGVSGKDGPLTGPALDEAACAGMESFFATIDSFHEQSRSQGIEYPEVDIMTVWTRVLAELGKRGLILAEAESSIDVRRLAVEYESRANPVWPMPGLEDCLASIRHAGLTMGIVSNAQFYTRELFPALLGKESEQLGFDPKLEFYSYQYGWGKPGSHLYELAAEELHRRQIEPENAIFVGNDMLNDILPAKQVGFRTALFAGDGRSLRLREGDCRTSKTTPDLILSDLGQLRDCIIDR
jgi:putative hydrolase of the HAD superfamily